MICRARLALRDRRGVDTVSSGDSGSGGWSMSSFDSSFSCLTSKTARTLRMKICRGSFEVMVFEEADTAGGEATFFEREVAVGWTVTWAGERLGWFVVEVWALVLWTTSVYGGNSLWFGTFRLTDLVVERGFCDRVGLRAKLASWVEEVGAAEWYVGGWDAPERVANSVLDFGGMGEIYHSQVNWPNRPDDESHKLPVVSRPVHLLVKITNIVPVQHARNALANSSLDLSIDWFRVAARHSSQYGGLSGWEVPCELFPTEQKKSIGRLNIGFVSSWETSPKYKQWLQCDVMNTNLGF